MDRTPARIAPPVPFEWELDRGRDQVVVLRNISWDQYVAINEAREGRQPLLAYLDGELELVTVSRRHEFVKKLVARLVEAFADETRTKLNGFGGATLRNKAKQAGCEPDEWYCVGKSNKEAPDLAIEVVHTSGGIDKLEVYRRLGAREVWFFISGRFWLYRLAEGRYKEIRRSIALPRIDLDQLVRIIAVTDEDEQTEAVRTYRQSLRRRR